MRWECANCASTAPSDQEIAACEVRLDIAQPEAELLREGEGNTGARGPTLVALALI